MVSQRGFAESCQLAVAVLAQVADGDYASADAVLDTGKSRSDLVRLVQAMALVVVSTTEMFDHAESRLGCTPRPSATDAIGFFCEMAATYALGSCAEGGPS